MEKILVIGAHYDDAELGVGGSMAKWNKEGKEVFKLTLTDSVTNFEKRKIKIDFEDSKKESANACKILGVKEITDIPIQYCESLAFEKKHMQLIESFILDNNIDTIVFHYISDVHQDHVNSSIISYVAGRYCDNLLMFQSNKYILPLDFYPRFFVDITETIKLKAQALNCYSHVNNRYNQLFETTISQNRIWGYQSTMNQNEKFAEAFSIIKYVSR